MPIKKIHQSSLKKTRLRFPPSPTGPLHIGNARTALFNYLFAKQHRGKLILRIEDTDQERSELTWVQEIIEELRWLGISWDEGPDIDGPFGPYKQSQRLDIYKKYLQQLLEEGKAYYCFCSPEELEAKRQDQMARGLAPKYDGTCRNLTKTAVEKNHEAGKQSVIRFRVENKKITFKDLVRGDVTFDTSLLGDIVVAKGVQTPLYHFAVVIDDYLMEISHVLRGEDHLSNTPKQILLQEALGFSQPLYGHIPLLLNQDKSKLSKRVGDVALKDYHRQGYLPEALVNFVALLGWNPGTDRELFSMQELQKAFSLERVQKAGAIFNIQKLNFINSAYIKQKPTDALTKLCKPYLAASYEKFPQKTLEKIVEIYKARLKKLSDITDLTDFFFKDTLVYDKKLLVWDKMGDREVKESLRKSEKVLSAVKKFDKKNLEEILLKEAETFNAEKNYSVKNRGYLLWPLRVALSGKEASASPFEIAEILGKEKTLQRISNAIHLLG